MRTGDLVPDFELPDQEGVKRKLSEFLEKGPVVLFFYPAALTPGCTKESCHFRDLAADPVEKQRTFSDKHGFDYPLLSDEDRQVASQFGVKRAVPFLPNKRATFVIGTDRKVVEVITSEINMDKHADLALEALRR
jgi:thioredoxin-dependent peroxiredoxin